MAREPDDDYAKLLTLLHRLNPTMPAPEEGVSIAVVAAFLPPSDEYRTLIALRRLVDDFRLEHVQGCDCPLCARAQELLGDAQKRLSGTLFHADGRVEHLDEAGVRKSLASVGRRQRKEAAS